MALYDKNPVGALFEAAGRTGPSAGRWEIPTHVSEDVTVAAKDAMGVPLTDDERAILNDDQPDPIIV